MKIAIVGSRNYSDLNQVKDFVFRLDTEHTIVSGGAIGVDSVAELAAIQRNMKTIIFKPDWNKYGKRAGFLRNEFIIDEADIVVAFWDEISKGAKHSIDLAHKKGKKVKVFTASTYPCNIEVFTDGSGTVRKKPGGWAYVVVVNGKRRIHGSGGQKDTTNNQMELMAAFMGLFASKGVYDAQRGDSVTLVADSEYTLNQALKKHRTKANKGLVKALQLSMKMLDADARHVKAHSGNKFNEFVDKLAGIERKKLL